MVKSIFKELIILLLLVVAILLILGVLFYEYIPSNKIIPNKVAYNTPSNITEEISQEVSETSPVNIIYSLDEKDINMSKKSGEYQAGKQNPFDSYAEKSTVTGNQAGTTGNSNGNTNTNTGSNSSNTGNSSNSGFLPDSGTK